MSPTPHEGDVAVSLQWRIDQVCLRFERAWQAGQIPCIEDYLDTTPEPDRALLFRELLALELAYRCRDGQMVVVEEYRQRFAERAELVEAVFAKAGLAPQRSKVVDGSSASGSTDPGATRAEEAAPPGVLGRYRVQAQLGAGSFGVVYRGYDEELRREVAIKVPHRHRIAQPEDADLYLAEARTVAGLDHPHIVPVYDVGRTGDGLCYIVSKFIEGSDLKRKLAETALPFTETARLVAAVAEALHHAHGKGLVHRDIKPSNILLDNSGCCYVADFGLALREEDAGKAASFAGTPSYMSPEQARGEGHRVNNRSDIFCLGVVFYELLTGQRPFQGETHEELLEQIITADAPSPCQVNGSIPKELERICLKTLAKRASERYATAKGLADDLRHFLDRASGEEKDILRSTISARSTGMSDLGEAADPNPRPVKIVPKGLRAFDADDADSFVELLPGPRDREGLPDSLRFWKSRIEQADADKGFVVGLLYGPSGCGKSSLVKAGLLPRLAPHVLTVYVEATAEETEGRLLKGLRRHCPELSPHLGLVETLTHLRRGLRSDRLHAVAGDATAPDREALLNRGTTNHPKILIVLDQFEQWLHAKRGEQNTELVQALRQCDGERLQCFILVRDDFWLAVSRFMGDLEVELVQGRNMALVDLFDPPHAKKVLAAFGRAFAALPEGADALSKDEEAFLGQAVEELSQDGKIISVRLALFAEVVKGRPWTPATLKALGGVEGVGVRFLEETFAAETAPAQHRVYQRAAQAILKALLPETGTDIKGHMRSRQDLLTASGYAPRPRDFDALLRILDGELRLITPTDPEGVEGGRWRVEGTGFSSPSTLHLPPSTRYYQLTHDYLVPSLRDWLSRKQKETRKGRAELRLAERAAVWDAKPESLHLPPWWEWANIRFLTNKNDWTTAERKMMRQASRYHAVRGLLLAAGLCLATGIGLSIRAQVIEQSNSRLAAGLVQRLFDAETAQVPAIVVEMEDHRRALNPLLQEEYRKAAPGSRQKLRTCLALLPFDPSQTEYLFEQLLNAEAQEVPAIRDALFPHKQALVDQLWTVLQQPAQGQNPRRLRAACALATYDPDNLQWGEVGDRIANDLVSVPFVHLERWMDALRPVRARLVDSLSDIFRDTNREPTERIMATNILADYAVDQYGRLAELLMDADEKQFAILYAKVTEQRGSGLSLLLHEVNKQLPPDAKEESKEKLAKRQANAAVALLRMNRSEKVWPLLKHSPDPRVRSYLIHRLGPLGADVRAVVQRLEEEPEISIRRALVLSLGEFGEMSWPPGERGQVGEKLRDLYRTAPDPGLHGAVEWLLRQWKQSRWLQQIDEEWSKDKQHRERKLERIRQELAHERQKAKPQWYLNGQGQTMVILPGPVEFMMGSPDTESPRLADREHLHLQRIGRTFAVATKHVTVGQFLRFNRSIDYKAQFAPTHDCPVHGVTWYMAAAYCNWSSKEEGIPREQWCYETNPQGEVTKLKDQYLSLTGYRLPTGAEWEYACRAGSLTCWYYGAGEELLGKYAWYSRNSDNLSRPVGSLKPNDFGLFDGHGNVWCWCQEGFRWYWQHHGGQAVEDPEDDLSLQEARVLRGGCFIDRPWILRSAFRDVNAPTAHTWYIGFRVAKTFR